MRAVTIPLGLDWCISGNGSRPPTGGRLQGTLDLIERQSTLDEGFPANLPRVEGERLEGVRRLKGLWARSVTRTVTGSHAHVK